VRRTMPAVLLRIADRAGFVNFPAVKADVGGCRFNGLARNLEIPTAAMLRELAALLRGVVFVG
jgi:hypothetical protein